MVEGVGNLRGFHGGVCMIGGAWCNERGRRHGTVLRGIGEMKGIVMRHQI